MKRWIWIFTLVALAFSQGAAGFHDHPVTEEPTHCAVCSHLHCFSLPAVAELLPPTHQEVLGRALPKQIHFRNSIDDSVVTYAPKTSPPSV